MARQTFDIWVVVDEDGSHSVSPEDAGDAVSNYESEHGGAIFDVYKIEFTTELPGERVVTVVSGSYDAPQTQPASGSSLKVGFSPREDT
jgi:hypothetical protein